VKRRPTNVSKLFVTSCVSLVTTAMVFAIRGDVAQAMGDAFHLTQEQLGLIFSPAFWCFTIAIFVSGAVVDAVGMRALHIASAIGYFFAVALIVFAPHPHSSVSSIFGTPGTTLLYMGFMLLGLSQGVVEGVVNPLVATLYPEEKTRRLNRLHAWWPGGLMIGGLLAYAVRTFFHARWEAQFALILLPAAIYLLQALTHSYPQTERAQSDVTNSEMWREIARPGFIALFACMWMTAALELGPDQWFPSVMGALVPQLQGVLYLVYTAGIVFLLRTFGANVAHRSPVMTLVICSTLAGLGLYWLGSLHSGGSAFVALLAASLFGIGKSFLWPTMLGVTAERFPRGGALALCLMGGAGMASVAIVLPIMGGRIDRYGPGAALQMVSVLGALVAVLMILQLAGGREAQMTGRIRPASGKNHDADVLCGPPSTVYPMKPDESSVGQAKTS
jgi:MFS family permease